MLLKNAIVWFSVRFLYTVVDKHVFLTCNILKEHVTDSGTSVDQWH